MGWRYFSDVQTEIRRRTADRRRGVGADGASPASGSTSEHQVPDLGRRAGRLP
jgi:hypothetical protein